MTPTERLSKIAAIVEHAQDRTPAYLDSAEMLRVYLLATIGDASPGGSNDSK